MRLLTLAIFAVVAARPVLQTPEVPPVVRAGLDAYKAGDIGAALDVWFKNSPAPRQTIPTTRGAFEQVEASYGHMTGYDLLEVVPFGTHATRTYAILLYEKGPVYAWFDCFKTGDGWILTGFLFNTKPDLILPATMLGHVPQPPN